MSIVAEDDGMVYTFDVASGEIRQSDGVVLALDYEQAEMAGAAFLRTIAADRMVPGVESMVGTCGGEMACEPVEPYRVGEGDSDEPAGTSRIVVRFPDTDVERPLRRPVVSLKRPPLTPPGSVGSPSGGDDISLMSYGDPCTDVANAALQGSNNFRGERTSFIQDVVLAAIAEFGNKVKHILPKGSIAAGVWTNRTADHFFASTQLTMLAWYWNSYDCANRDVFAGPIWQSSSSGTYSGSGGGGFSCNMAWVDISFTGDGGPWYTVFVEVCTYGT